MTLTTTRVCLLGLLAQGISLVGTTRVQRKRRFLLVVVLPWLSVLVPQSLEPADNLTLSMRSVQIQMS